MAKEKEEVKVEKSDPRAERWEAFLETYKKQNPDKYAVKDAKGDFKKIPEGFL